MDSYTESSPQTEKTRRFFDPQEKQRQRSQQVRKFISGISNNPNAIKTFLRELNTHGIKPQTNQTQRGFQTTNLTTDYSDYSASKHPFSKTFKSRGLSMTFRSQDNDRMSTAEMTRHNLMSQQSQTRSREDYSVSQVGKAYFLKYIDGTNKRLHELQKRKRAAFIPEHETQQLTYKEKFQHYLTQMEEEEIKNKKESRNKTSLENTQTTLIKPQKDYLETQVNEREFYTSEKKLKQPRRNIQINQIQIVEQNSTTQPQQQQSRKISFNDNDNFNYKRRSRDKIEAAEFALNSDAISQRSTILLKVKNNTQAKNSFRNTIKNASPLRLVSMGDMQKLDRGSNMDKLNFAQRYKQLYQETMRGIKDQMQGDYYKIICQEPQNQNFKNLRLQKYKFKQFLVLRYGNQIADKLQNILDFGNHVDFQSYSNQIDAFVKNKDLLVQLAFDIYDGNSDGKISEMDLFKIFSYFDRSNYEVFEKAFYRDLCQLIKFIKAKQINNGGGSDEEKFDLEQKLDKYFRNIMEQDSNATFLSKKRQIFQSMYKLIELTKAGENWGSRLFLNQSLDGVGLISQVEQKQKEREEQGNEEKEEGFFSNSTYHQQIAKRTRFRSKQPYPTDNLSIQSSRAKGNKNAIVPYYQYKMLKIQTQANSTTLPSSGVTPSSYSSNKSQNYQQQLWDQFFTSYVEDTQSKINEFIKVEEFNNMRFHGNDICEFIFDLIDYLTGTTGLFQKLLKQVTTKAQQQLRKTTTNNDISSLDLLLLGSSSKNNNIEEEESVYSLCSVSPRATAARNRRDQEISSFRQEITHNQFRGLSVAFQILAQGCYNEFTNLHDLILTKQTIKQNFVKLFQYDSPFMAQFLYMFLSNNKESSPIDFVRFGTAFLPLSAEESKEKRNNFIFKFLDIDKDGILGIINCIQMLKNLPKNSLIVLEIYKLMKEYKDKTILMRDGFRAQIQLNFFVYNKIIPASCLIREFLYRFFELTGNPKESQKSDSSPFREMSDQELKDKFQITIDKNLISEQQYEIIFKPSVVKDAPKVIANLI